MSIFYVQTTTYITIIKMLKMLQEIKISAVHTVGLCAYLDVTLLALISRT